MERGEGDSWAMDVSSTADEKVHLRVGHCNQTLGGLHVNGRTLVLISLSKGRSSKPAMVSCWLVRVRVLPPTIFVSCLLHFTAAPTTTTHV
ncbi:hypothetical protein GOBAR_AA04984 [Gossypium barbadense]|uniref:FHA domain-containing protein n=1 Tax=Gossypium barbadense TaxID=3634 RepID=A0A2P5YJ15_GOSBA|nr:hypothetical protein GOBAR_AA04984 [Gossypium barbadense]